MQDYFLGVDIGTSGARAVLFDASGYEAAAGRHEYALVCPRPGWMELDPEEVLSAVISAVSQCVARSGVPGHRILGLGFSSQMHSLMAIDGEGRPITNLVTWADNRSLEEARFIGKNYPVQELNRKTGCCVQHPFYPVSKILWFKRHHPELAEKAGKWMTIKDYILFRLFGQQVTDYTLASAQGFYNIHIQDWDEDILKDVLGIDRSVLCPVVPCLYALTGLIREYADAMGLSEGITCAVGSGDGVMANLGCGVMDSSAISSTIGTSGALRTTVLKPIPGGQSLWCYSFTDDRWVAGGAISNGGVVFKWFGDNFRDQFEKEAADLEGNIYRLFDKYAEEVPPGCEGLVFLPYLAGERNPDWNSRATGVMWGLTFAHSRKHLVRAAMEGILFRLYSIYEILEKQVDPGHEIRAGGGYARSRVWLSMQADIFGRRIAVPAVTEASALGAAFLAMAAAGAVDGIDKPLPSMKDQVVVEPDPGNHGIYRETYEKAMMLYEITKKMAPKEGEESHAEE